MGNDFVVVPCTLFFVSQTKNTKQRGRMERKRRNKMELKMAKAGGKIKDWGCKIGKMYDGR